MSTVADGTPVRSNRCLSIVTVFAHYAPRMLTTIRLHPTRLETRTKESNMCASLRVLETQRQNESEDGFGR